MKTVRCCFFDIGNVCIFFDRMKMVDALALCCKVTPDTILEFLEEGTTQKYESGLLSFDEIYILFEKRLGRQLSPQAIKKALCAGFSANPDIEPLIWRLKKANIPMFAISNTCDVHFEHLYKHFAILRLFTGYILSYEAKALKPSPLIFQKAIEKSGFLPSNCFFVDDIPEFAEAAEKMGMHGYTFEDAYALESKLISLEVIQ